MDRMYISTIRQTEEDVLIDYGLLGKAAEVAGFRRVWRRRLLFDARPGEVYVEEE
jgi:hypothetical protein